MILITQKCLDQIEKREEPESIFWENIIPSSMWSEVHAIQVVSWRMMNRFKNESWAAEAIDMIYIEDDILEWAKETGDHLTGDALALHKDCNGNVLQNGDTVTLIKDLDVKGASFNAKIGTPVRNIRLVNDDHEQIEGKIDGQTIIILTKFVKKQ
ncbi:alkylphosphonate utilization protein [Flavobacterium rakeshii]|uniref:alkylphosphonate utilization protein n=1 Tax=Flavobacterium rakeshii TaxID=1038845 RepID=UPI002E7C2A4C|nr:alkylphosphonate utilization protein [Flavobacterium rakeshii]MEE1896955.1 alkylphosphonate utilization protein [Flavobacterium rakeshii]